MKIINVILLCTGLVAAGSAVAATNFAGEYDCKGTDPTFIHQAYESKFTMTQQAKNSYTTVQTDDQNNTYKSIVIYNDNHLSAAFYLVSNSEIIGVEQYTVMDNGDLKGTFVYYNAPTKIGTEVCKKLS